MDRERNGVGLIPNQLLSNLKKGDCVLFLGADRPLRYENSPASFPELATALREKFELTSPAWPEAAQEYLGQYPNDRHTLVSFLAERATAVPGPLHRAIAQAGFRAIELHVPAPAEHPRRLGGHICPHAANRACPRDQLMPTVNPVQLSHMSFVATPA